MAVEICVPFSAKESPMPGSFRTNSKSSTSHQKIERQTEKPEVENASDREGLMEGTEGVDELVSSQCKSSNRNKVGRGGSGRKRFARGPRSGNKSISMLVGCEDHRVVSTEYQCWAGGAEVEVVMKVTLLAAGFVIGARGASVREIGQATGALVQSWTETDCAHPAALPVRFFHIQGSKRAVEAAVYVIQEAVAKYRALCECKSRGEFVQREHVINGVEFFYQPPPKMALPRLRNSAHSLNLSRNHVWSMPQLHSPAFGCNCFEQFKHHDCFKPKDDAVYNRHLLSPDKNRGVSKIGYRNSWPGLFHCLGFKQQDQEEEMPKSMNANPNKISAEEVLSMEEKLRNLDMEDADEKKKRSVDPWSVLVQEREKQDHMNCSLFSYFGPEGLPLPISPFSSTAVNSKTLENPEQGKLNSIDEWPPYLLF